MPYTLSHVQIVNLRFFLVFLFCIGCFCLFVQPIHAAEAGTGDVLYQTSFSKDPGWTTNSPSRYFWDLVKGQYHYKIEPATGAYAYIDVKNYDDSAFTLEYEVTPVRTDPDAAFRFGFGSTEMDFTRGTCVISEFMNTKYGRILGIRVITQSGHMTELTSLACSYGGINCNAPTRNFADGQTYQVAIQYVPEDKTVSMSVNYKANGTQLWNYFTKTGEALHGMKRLYITSVGDYTTASYAAEGYLDDVKLYRPGSQVAQTTITGTPSVTVPAMTRTTVPVSATKTAQATPNPTQSPSLPLIAALAFGLAAVLCILMSGQKRD
jgi:hypothetical protein